MSGPPGTGPAADALPGAIEELLRTMVKALRAFQMYLPNNPMHQRAVQQVAAAFGPVWAGTEELVLAVGEQDLRWEDRVVYQQANRAESLAWLLYKDGMRLLTLQPGAERGEVIAFLETVGRARLLPPEAGDDLRTLLWAQDFAHIDCRFLEGLVDTAGLLGGTGFAPGHAAEPTATAQQVRAEAGGAGAEDEAAAGAGAAERRPGIVDPDEFDSTLYFLDPAEIDLIAREVRHEYARDVRGAALAALFDVLELQDAAPARAEALDVLDTLFPNLLSHGEFRAAAAALRDMRVVAERGRNLRPGERERLTAFEARLSEPAILEQLLDSIHTSATAPSADDVGELLRELGPTALETIVAWIPRMPAGPVRMLLEDAADRLAAAHPAEVLRLLRSPGTVALTGVIGICERRQLQGAVPGLVEALQRDDVAVRRAAVSALAVIGSPGALAALDRALEDADRGVRIAAVRELGRRGHRGGLARVEAVVQGRVDRDLDLDERRAFFEAYGLIAGPGAVATLSALLMPRGLFKRRESPDVRACAAFGLGRVRTDEARRALEGATADPDPKVRNAVGRALKDAGPPA